MYQQLWGYKVEDKLYLGVREQKRLNTTALENPFSSEALLNILQRVQVFTLGAVSPLRNPKLEAHPGRLSVTVYKIYSQLSSLYLVVVSSIRNLRTHHAVITGDLLNIG
jgi:hypothetical protein